MIILCNILEPITEVFGGKRLSVRPFVSAAQMKREDSAILDIHRCQDVGYERQRRGVADQPRIPVNHHHAGVLWPTHQHPQLAAGIADCLRIRNFRIARQPFFDLGQLSAGYVFLEKRRLMQLGLGRAGNGHRKNHDEADPFHIVPPD